MMKLFKETEKGRHDSMMEGIELLIDTKAETAFDEGYKSCLSDMSVRAERLAEYLENEAVKRGTMEKGIHFSVPQAGIAHMIEEYFNDALNNKK
jgi:hypothetical protein